LGISENTEVFVYSPQSISSEEIEIIDNQIYYSTKQLTFEYSNKKKPMRISENEEVFVSDNNSGIGFYDLRKIELEIGK
jgi:hypothetical protein